VKIDLFYSSKKQFAQNITVEKTNFSAKSLHQYFTGNSLFALHFKLKEPFMPKLEKDTNGDTGK
jgi:hypothetical protein